MNKREIYEVDGLHIMLTRIPVRRYEWGHGEAGLGHPKEQALYEITIDGDLVGYASRPHGWGKQSFGIDRIGDAFHGGYGDTRVYGAGYLREEDRLYALDAVARKAAELRRAVHWGTSKVLPTQAELELHIADYEAMKARDAREAEARRQQWEKESRERRAKAKEQRLDILGGLRSIDDRLSDQLSNYEANALRAAITCYEIKPR